MNRERAKELLPIIRAFAEGKIIQFKTGARWIDLNDNTQMLVSINDELEYRIKPEPREFWIHENMDQVLAVTGTPHGWKPVPCDKYIKVREIIE